MVCSCGVYCQDTGHGDCRYAADGRVTKFENALIELIEIHMDGGLTGAEVSGVLIARAWDDFDAAKVELDLTKVVGGPQTEAVKRFTEGGA